LADAADAAMRSRTLGLATVIALLLVVALVLVLGERATDQATTASPTATSSPSASATATPTVPAAASATSVPSAGGGTITGELGYPSNFIPALRVYAISVADERVHFFVDTPQYGGSGAGTATVPPGERQPSYTITGVAPGTYYVLGYQRSLPSGSPDRPGLYSNFVVRCINPTATTPAQPTVASECTQAKENHALVPVTVRAGETVTRIDVKDWYYLEATYPARPR
jgi:hypothetical protein